MSDGDPSSAATELAPSSPTDSAPRLIGQVIGRYRIEAVLGSGSFGTVYRGTDVESQVPVAVKVLRALAATAPAIIRLKRRELGIMRRVETMAPSPNVLKSLEPDVIEWQGLHLIVLEYVDGRSLASVIAEERMLEIAEARRIALDLALGLVAIHEVGGVHRDLKPENVRLRASGSAVILDLGIAGALWHTETLTATDQRPMTPLYAAPEQLLGGEVGPPADVYALGLILFEMFNGVVPLSGRSSAELLVARTSGVKIDPRTAGRAVPRDMAELTTRCLAVDPKARPTAAECVEVLRSGSAVGLAHTERADQRDAPPRQRRRGWIAVGVAAVALTGTALLLLHSSQRDAVFSNASASAVASIEPSGAPPSATVPSSATSSPSLPLTTSPPPIKPTGCPPGAFASKGHCCPAGREWTALGCRAPLH